MAQQTLIQPPMVIRVGALGDTVVTIGLLRWLARRFGSSVDVVCHSHWGPALLSNLPFVGQVFSLKSRKTPFVLSQDQQNMVRWIRQRNPSAVYLVESGHIGRKLETLVLRAGVPKTHIISAETFHQEIERDKHWIFFLKQLGQHVPEGTPLSDPSCPFEPQIGIRLSSEEIRSVKHQLEDWGVNPNHAIVLVHPGNGRIRRFRFFKHDPKQWPVQRWHELIRFVLDSRPKAQVLITGAQREKQLASTLARNVASNRVFPIAGMTTVRQLAALCNMAHSFVGIDSGPGHLAAACGCPVVVLFGSYDDPRFIGPLSQGSPVSVVTGRCMAHPPKEAQTSGTRGEIRSISSEMVINAWTQLGSRQTNHHDCPLAPSP